MSYVFVNQVKSTSIVMGLLSNRAVFLLFIANLLEHYCFIIYAYLTPYISSSIFDNSLDFALIVFTLGYLLRPISGVLFGVLSDRFGRKNAGLTALCISGFSVVIIAILPNSNWVWVFIFLRILHGISHSGFMGVALTYTSEFKKKSNAMTGIMFMGVALSSMAANSSCLLLEHIFTNEQMVAFGWRIPYFAGLVLFSIALYVRNKIPEPHTKNLPVSFYEVFTNVWQNFAGVFAAFLMALPSAALVMISVQLPTLITYHYSVDHSYSLTFAFYGSLAYLLTIALFTRFDLKKSTQYLFALSGMLVISVLYVSLHFKHLLVVYIAQRFMLANLALSYSNFISKRFDASTRNTAIGFGYSLAFFLAAIIPNILKNSVDLMNVIGLTVALSAMLGLIGFSYLRKMPVKAS